MATNYINTVTAYTLSRNTSHQAAFSGWLFNRYIASYKLTYRFVTVPLDSWKGINLAGQIAHGVC